jgi:hypothetical protein
MLQKDWKSNMKNTINKNSKTKWKGGRTLSKME